jgi:methylenetetrahydrofolate reductase (NADPH)
LYDSLEPLKNDDEAVRKFGIKYCAKQSQELIDFGCRFLHYYTMNLEASVVKTIVELGILKKHRYLPFSCSASYERKTEDVRPIFWANKPSSYL